MNFIFGCWCVVFLLSFVRFKVGVIGEIVKFKFCFVVFIELILIVSFFYFVGIESKYLLLGFYIVSVFC